MGDGAPTLTSFAASFRGGILIARPCSTIAHEYSVLTRQVDKIVDMCGEVSAQSAAMFPVGNGH
jgi:hypothetical protein